MASGYFGYFFGATKIYIHGKLPNWARPLIHLVQCYLHWPAVVLPDFKLECCSTLPGKTRDGTWALQHAKHKFWGAVVVLPIFLGWGKCPQDPCQWKGTGQCRGKQGGQQRAVFAPPAHPCICFTLKWRPSWGKVLNQPHNSAGPSTTELQPFLYFKIILYSPWIFENTVRSSWRQSPVQPPFPNNPTISTCKKVFLTISTCNPTCKKDMGGVLLLTAPDT